jgi:glycosyltransferase involved in cell wall biosynthesis
MRIAFYAPLKPPGHPSPSGDRRMARLLIAALRRAGHEVSLASRLRSHDPGGDPARQRRIAGIGARLAAKLIATWRAVPPSRRPQAWFTYHLYHKAPDWLGPPVSRALGIPYLVAEASYAPKRAGGAWDFGQRAAAAAIAAADAILVLNPADRDCLLPLVDGPGRLVPLPPFIDTASYAAAAGRRAGGLADAALRRRLGLDPAAPLLLAVAMMRPGDKLASYRLLAEALVGLGERRWQLLIVGDGLARPAVEEAFAPLGPRVAYAGSRSGAALLECYAAADLYAWPAVSEAWGMTLLEAQASGLPVVAGAEGGVPAVVANGTTGLVTPPRDVAAFRAAIARLLDDPAGRIAMGAAAAARMAQQHDIATAARQLDETLRTVVAARRRRVA